MKPDYEGLPEGQVAKFHASSEDSRRAAFREKGKGGHITASYAHRELLASPSPAASAGGDDLAKEAAKDLSPRLQAPKALRLHDTGHGADSSKPAASQVERVRVKLSATPHCLGPKACDVISLVPCFGLPPWSFTPVVEPY